MKETDLISGICQETSKKVTGGHVLAIQDTTEFNFAWNRNRKKADSGLGRCRHQYSLGFMLHPTLAINADTDEVYGFSHIHIWHREAGNGTKHTRDYHNQPVEEKESNKWTKSSLGSINTLKGAGQITIVEDREGDIYQQFCDVPNQHVHLLVRNSQDRRLDNGNTLRKHLAKLPSQGTYKIEIIQTVSSKQGKRKIELAVKFDKVTLIRPKILKGNFPETIQINIIQAQEINPPSGQSPVNWRLMTTHQIGSMKDATTVINWYSKRWYIEQVFRLLKRKGFQIGSSELESGWAIRKLTVLSMKSALTILQLRLSQQSNNKVRATQVFSKLQIACLKGLNKQFQGNTNKQLNPHTSSSLAWATWIIARLGGWKGYESQRPPGLITLKYGLEKFDTMYQGLIMFKNVENVYTP